MMDALYRYFWADSKTRRIVYSFSAILGIFYGTLREVVFHKPEPQVCLEIAAVLFSVNLIAIVVYCLRYIRVADNFLYPANYRLSPLFRYAGIAALIILLGAPKISVSSVQAAIVNRQLEKAASSIEGNKVSGFAFNDLTARFKNIESIANASIRYKIPANPRIVEKVEKTLQQTLKSANTDEAQRSGVAAFVALVAYARYNELLVVTRLPTILVPHGETGNYLISKVPLQGGAVWWQGSSEGSTVIPVPSSASDPVFPVSRSKVVFNEINFAGFGPKRPFIATDNQSEVVVMNATISEARQKLDSIVWLRIVFQSSVIIYNGGPLYLGDVSFRDCDFQFGNDPESQKVLAQIKQAEDKPVTLVSGLGN
jgi:hypothetical protein